MTTEGSTRRDPPAPRPRAEYPQMELKGTVTVTGDIMEPVFRKTIGTVFGHLERRGSRSG